MGNNVARTVKSCDLPDFIALEVFRLLNTDYTGHCQLQVKKPGKDYRTHYQIITDCEPKDLVYPDGWYYAKGCFRNKHTSTTGFYCEVRMFDSNGNPWGSRATYCTHE